MGKTAYSRNPSTPKVARASGKDIRAHYKNTYETAKAIKGMSLVKAKQYMKDVLAHKRCVPFTKHFRGIGRTGQAAEFGKTRWSVEELRRGRPGGAYLRGGRPHRPRAAARALSGQRES